MLRSERNASGGERGETDCRYVSCALTYRELSQKMLRSSLTQHSTKGQCLINARHYGRHQKYNSEHSLHPKKDHLSISTSRL